MYIYESTHWPNFTWHDDTIVSLLTELRFKQGLLFGKMNSIGFAFQRTSVLENLTEDVVKSSEIEGEILDPPQVRSSVARHLGMEAADVKIDKNVEGVVEMILDATQHFEKPLTRERLFKWHRALFPEGRSGFKKIRTGGWRQGPIQVISGYRDREIVHFEGPPAELVAGEMKTFLAWVNCKTSMDLVLKAAIAHLWFVTIHPFDDGNGRIGRAIADLILARSEHSSQRCYSLSGQIQKERKGYYEHLEKTQKGLLDITPWIVWFFGCLGRAIDRAISVFDLVLHRAKVWEDLSHHSLNERQKKVINCLLEFSEGELLTSSKWAKIAKCSQDTAYRDIQDLIHQGILVKNPEGGRATSYTLNTKR